MRAFASSLEHPLYWAGPRPGSRYELTRAAAGFYVRYLPAGVQAGDPRGGRFLTIGTYPEQDAFAQVQAAGRRPGAVTIELAGGRIAVYNRSRPTNVYFASPGSPVQVEVYDPAARTSRHLVRDGKIVPVGTEAVSKEGLRSVAFALGHPLYWAGPRPGSRYELTRTAVGLYVRYLPAGVQAGDPRGGRFLTIGTYPKQDAFAQVQAAGRRPGGVTLKLAGGRIAVYNRSRPTNVYLAFPGSLVQVEVYDPSAWTARHLALTGQVAPIR